jgi:hypothetical protein
MKLAAQRRVACKIKIPSAPKEKSWTRPRFSSFVVVILLLGGGGFYGRGRWW